MASPTNHNEFSEVITEAPRLNAIGPLLVERNPADVEEEARKAKERQGECCDCCCDCWDEICCRSTRTSDAGCFDSCLTFFCYDLWARICGNGVDICCLTCCCDADGNCCGNCGDCDCGGAGDSCGDFCTGCDCNCNCCDF